MSAFVPAAPLHNHSSFLPSATTPQHQARHHPQLTLPSVKKSRIDIACHLKQNSPVPANCSPPEWARSIQKGTVVEVWSASQIHFGLVRSLYEKGVRVDLASATSGLVSTTATVKKSFDEIISIWPSDTAPSGENAWSALVADVAKGLTILRNSSPRNLDLTPLHARLTREAKGHSAPQQSSSDVAQLIFPKAFLPTLSKSDTSRELRASATIAGAFLVASDSIRFKRAGPGAGWRILPVSVVESRQRSSFAEKCKAILDGKTNSPTDCAKLWTREELELLREIQIVAASGTAASGTAATALRSLGYEEDDNGATKLLLDVQYWTRGKPTNDTLRGFKRDNSAVHNGTTPTPEQMVDSLRNQRPAGTVRDWAFPQEILSEARDVRKRARIKRLSLLDGNAVNRNEYRRTFPRGQNGRSVEVFCVDDKKSRFLDDAFSVVRLNDRGLVRVLIHIADVDEVVTSGSAIDIMARDRGESLYLPLKPLHMLPAAVMEAASFDAVMATEAITISVDVDLHHELVCNWEVFASVVPPVTRLDYDQFDLALNAKTTSLHVTASQVQDLQLIAKAAPILSAKLDERKPARRQRRRSDPFGSGTDPGLHHTLESNGIAAVRLVKKTASPSKTVKMAEVVDFRTTGSHTAVDYILTSAGSLLRRFAKENNAHLPEGQYASSYVARCGTAPLRRYLDLAIQRQIKCVLFGRQPAGRRRMNELRTWLAKRHSAGERTITEKRRSALFDSFSNHCARQRLAAGLDYAIVHGRVLNGSVTKHGKPRFVVNLEGTGLSTTASVSSELLQQIKSVDVPPSIPGNGSNNSPLPRTTFTNISTLEKAKSVVPYQSRVRVAVQAVDVSAQRIQALITEVL